MGGSATLTSDDGAANFFRSFGSTRAPADSKTCFLLRGIAIDDRPQTRRPRRSAMAGRTKHPTRLMLLRRDTIADQLAPERKTTTKLTFVMV